MRHVRRIFDSYKFSKYGLISVSDRLQVSVYTQLDTHKHSQFNLHSEMHPLRYQKQTCHCRVELQRDFPDEVKSDQPTLPRQVMFARWVS